MNDVEFKKIFEGTLTPCLVLTPSYDIVAVNDTYLQATMTKRDDIVGKFLFHIFPDNPDDKGATGTVNLRRSLDEVRRTKRPDSMAVQKYDIRKANSDEFEVRYWNPVNAPILNAQGEIEYILHTVTDITDFVRQTSQGQADHEMQEIARNAASIQQKNQELIDSERRFRLMVDAVHDYAIMMLDKDGLITQWNAGAERLFQYTASEVKGRHVSMFTTGVPSTEIVKLRELEDAFNNHRFEEEGVRVRRDGTQFWANVIVSPIFNEKSEMMGYAKIIRNLTERKKNEDALKKLTEDLQEKAISLSFLNKELEAFCYSVSHDLRAPLRSMAGFSQILLEEYAGKLDDQGKNFLTRITSSSKFMGELIDGLLNLSRVTRQNINKETIHLSALVQNIFNEVKQSRNDSAMTLEAQANLTVQGDPLLLRAAIYNLVNNAFKFSAKSNEHRIQFGQTERQGSKVYFLKDFGAGFDMKYVDKLFLPFQRLHSVKDFEGTGIGLATVQRIVDKHGGKIWAEGEVGKGATFFFSLESGGTKS